jgi:hypothetical protein
LDLLPTAGEKAGETATEMGPKGRTELDLWIQYISINTLHTQPASDFDKTVTENTPQMFCEYSRTTKTVRETEIGRFYFLI